MVTQNTKELEKENIFNAGPSEQSQLQRHWVLAIFDESSFFIVERIQQPFHNHFIDLQAHYGY